MGQVSTCPAEPATRNFDHPDSLDWEMFRTQISSLRNAHAVDEPICRFELHNNDSRA